MPLHTTINPEQRAIDIINGKEERMLRRQGAFYLFADPLSQQRQYRQIVWELGGGTGESEYVTQYAETQNALDDVAGDSCSKNHRTSGDGGKPA